MKHRYLNCTKVCMAAQLATARIKWHGVERVERVGHIFRHHTEKPPATNLPTSRGGFL